MDFDRADLTVIREALEDMRDKLESGELSGGSTTLADVDKALDAVDRAEAKLIDG